MPQKKETRLSQEGYQKLVADLKDLKEVQLPAVLAKISEARQMGDLSENFEYKTGLEEKEFIETRISEIEAMLKNVQVVADDSGSKDTVDFGATVQLQIEDDDEQRVVRIVGSAEVGIEDDGTVLISLDSPVGIAIAGKKSGETAVMRMQGVKQNVEVISVQY